jgi:hypothetical protein
VPKTTPPASTTEEAPGETADLPGFRPPLTQPSNDPLDPTATRAEDGTPLAASPAGESSPWPRQIPGPPDDDWGNWGSGPREPSPTSTSRARGPSPVSTDPATFVKPLAAAVGMASVGVDYVIRTPEHLWVAGPEECADIATPLSRIVARHSPVGGTQASDLGDGIEAALGVANYALTRIWAAKEPPAEAATVVDHHQ